MNARALWACMVIWLLACGGASADYYYYGYAGFQFTDDNDYMWDALSAYPEWDVSRATLRDDWPLWDQTRTDARDCFYDDIRWYGSNLQSGDVLVVSYASHGEWQFFGDLDPADEGSTSRPQTNDPSPANSAPYAGDEWMQDPTSMFVFLSDDELTDAFAGFNPGVEVVVISAACHSGGWVGGSHDLNASDPAGNSALYALLGAPEQGTCVAVAENEGDPLEVLLTTALTNSLEPYMTISEWYEAAAAYGETAYYTGEQAWDTGPKDYYFWPSADWVPSTREQTYYDFADDALDHWGWQETYLQLRPIGYSSLDGCHDHPMGTPEPATTAMLLVGLAGLGAVLRRRA